MANITLKPIMITLETSLHIGAGFRRGLIDRSIMRDGRGQVYIPGSSLKGKVREACEWIANCQGLSICTPPYPARMCGEKGRTCIVCRIFGTPGSGSRDGQGLFLDNAYLPKDWRSAAGITALSYARTHVGLSRRRGIGKEGLLFTEEVSAERLTFESSISGNLALTPVLGERGRYYELILLISGLKFVKSLGGNNSRGIGGCQVDPPDTFFIKLEDGTKHGIETDWLLDRLELLSLYKDEVEEAE